MSNESIDLQPPLPDNMRQARLTWIASGSGKPKPTSPDRATAALLERVNEAGFHDQLRLSIDEANSFLNEVDALHGRRSSRPTTPSRTTPTRTTPTRTAPTSSTADKKPTTPTTRSAPTRLDASNRTTCTRCGGRMKSTGARHIVHVEDLDAFYRSTFSPEMLATTTVYDYECGNCHRLESFSTAS